MKHRAWSDTYILPVSVEKQQLLSAIKRTGARESARWKNAWISRNIVTNNKRCGYKLYRSMESDRRFSSFQKWQRMKTWRQISLFLRLFFYETLCKHMILNWNVVTKRFGDFSGIELGFRSFRRFFQIVFSWKSVCVLSILNNNGAPENFLLSNLYLNAVTCVKKNSARYVV